MNDEIDGAVLDEIRIVRFIDDAGEETISATRSGSASKITLLGMLDLTRDIFLRDDEPPTGD